MTLTVTESGGLVGQKVNHIQEHAPSEPHSLADLVITR